MIDTDPPLPVTRNSTQWVNFAERVAWTLVQAASAEALIAGFEALHGDIDTGHRAIYLVVLTTLLAAVKNAAAQAFGSPTGATLPRASQPVPAEDVVARTQGDGVVASTGSSMPNGTPVVVEGYVGAHEGVNEENQAEAGDPPQ